MSIAYFSALERRAQRSIDELLPPAPPDNDCKVCGCAAVVGLEFCPACLHLATQARQGDRRALVRLQELALAAAD